jgi:hypothetical protein
MVGRGIVVRLVLVGACGCAVAGGHENGGADTTGAVEQSDVCVDYLACAAAVDAETFASLSGTYGPEGSCWTQGQDFADTCTEACRSGVEDLAFQYSDEPACSAYAPPEVPLAAGDWNLNLQMDGEHDDCDLRAEGNPWRWTGRVDAADRDDQTFVWHIESYGSAFGDPTTLDCTYDAGLVFHCDGDRLTLDGERVASEKASGDWSWDCGSVSTGTFTAHVD